MVKTKFKQILLVAGESLLITLITVMSVVPVSCKITEQGIKLLDGDYIPPVLNEFVVVDENNLRLEFSEKVEVTGYVVSKVTDEYFSSEEHSSTLELSPAIERASGVYGSVPCTVAADETGCAINVLFEQPMEIGQGYEFYAEVSDIAGNTLTIAIPFKGFNSHIPELLITEVQTESISSQKSAEKAAGTYRNEFVELLVLKGGNLAGLELCSAYDGEEKKYVFPTLNVSTGEVIVVHMRNRGNGCISEEGENLAEAFSSYTNSEIRDLWTDIETTTLGNKTDILIIRNTADNRLLDAVMFRAGEVTEWSKGFDEYAELVGASGIYESGSIENAYVTDGMTASKTMARTDAAQLRQKVLDGEQLTFPITSNSEVWELISEATPGAL